VDGSLELCNCSCSFVVSISNYCTVYAASMNACIKPRKSDGDVDNAHKLLKVEAKI
jgi:hypothetical protein